MITCAQGNSSVGRSRGFDKANSGKYVISKVDRTYYSNRDMMGTQLTLVTDSPGA